MSVTARERNARGQGNLLRREVLDAVDRLVGDDERMRPKALALREVAREAGIAAPSIYQHFKNKEELIQAAVGEGFALLVQAMCDAAARCGDGARPSDRLAANARAYCRFAEEHRGYFRLMFVTGAMMVTLTVDGMDGLVDQWRSAVRDLPSQGVVTRLSTDELALFVWSTIHGRITLYRTLEAAHHGTGLEAFVDALIAEIASATG